MHECDTHGDVDDLVARFFAAFDNRDGLKTASGELAALFALGAVIARHGDGRCEVMSVDEFIRPRIALLQGGTLTGFHEWETAASTEIVGGIAARKSRYAKSGLLEGKPYVGTGTKFFQLARLEDGWRIVALAWIDNDGADARAISTGTGKQTG